MRITLSGDVTFTPDSKDATVNVPDPSYLNLGWWLGTDAGGNATSLRVDAWAMGDDKDWTPPTTGGGFDGLTGEAKFNGIAIGQYTEVTGSNSLRGGHFNATAKLMADFGETPDSGDDTTPGTLTGTIDEFQQDGVSLGDWKVELGAADQSGAPPFVGAAIDQHGTNVTGGSGEANAADSISGGAHGTFGLVELHGDWEARFVGGDRNDPLPGGIVGGFSIGGKKDLINMVGAFATENQVADSPE